MGRRFDGDAIFGWSDPNPGRWYVCSRDGCLYANADNAQWAEVSPECPVHRRRMVVLADA
jgi:hypothetical protein